MDEDDAKRRVDRKTIFWLAVIAGMFIVISIGLIVLDMSSEKQAGNSLATKDSANR